MPLLLHPVAIETETAPRRELPPRTHDTRNDFAPRTYPAHNPPVVDEQPSVPEIYVAKTT